MDSIFEPVENRETLSRQVMKQIENSIRNKVLLPSEKLPTEVDMAGLFGVSRPVVREALQMLSSRGLISIQKGSGAFVNEYSDALAFNPMRLYLELHLGKDLILQIAEMRLWLEPNIARLAAQNRNNQDIAALRDIMNRLSELDENDHHAQGEVDRDFHLYLANSTKSMVIPIIMEPLYQMLPKITELIRDLVEHTQEIAVDYHRRIFEHIIAGDFDGAFEEMDNHMKTAYEHSLIAAEKMK